MSSEVVATLAYSCPRCRVDLDAPSGRWDGWVRCPSCKRAFLPPELETVPLISGTAAVSSPFDGNPLEVGTPTGTAGFDVPRPLTGRMAHTSPARLVFTTGFVLCLLLTLIAFLDFKPGRLAIFGFLTIGFSLLLLRNPRKRLPVGGSTWMRPEAEKART